MDILIEDLPSLEVQSLRLFQQLGVGVEVGCQIRQTIGKSCLPDLDQTCLGCRVFLDNASHHVLHSVARCRTFPHIDVLVEVVDRICSVVVFKTKVIIPCRTCVEFSLSGILVHIHAPECVSVAAELSDDEVAKEAVYV